MDYRLIRTEMNVATTELLGEYVIRTQLPKGGYAVTLDEISAKGYTEECTKKGTPYFVDTSGTIVAKVCTKCSVVIAVDGFRKCKGRLAERRSWCKTCDSGYSQKHREDYPEVTRERNRISRELYPEKERERNRKHREVSPEKVTANRKRRIARKALLPDTLTLEQRSIILARFNGVCSLTGSIDYQMDHALPIGCGHGGTTYENMYPLRADLNTSKSDKHIFEWFNVNHERLGLSQAKFDALISYLAEVNGMTTKEYRMYVDWCFDNPRDIKSEESA